MEIILLENILNLGNIGDKVKSKKWLWAKLSIKNIKI